MTISRSSTEATHGRFLLRAMALAAAVGLAVGLAIGIRGIV